MAPAESVDRQLRRSSIVAGIGDGIAAVALPLLATRVTGDPLAIASVVAVQHVPWVLVHLAGRLGSLDRRTLVGLADTVRAMALGALGVLALTNAETLLAIQLAALFLGLGEAWRDRIEAESVSPGSLGASGMLAIGLLGFPVGGFLYDLTSGPATPLLADVLVFTLASTFALTIRGAVRPAAVRRPAATTTTGGERPRFPVVNRPLLVSAGLASAAASAAFGLLVLFATVDLGLGAPAFGLLLAGLAASTAVGGLAAPVVGEWLGLRSGLVLGLVLAGGGIVVAALVADDLHPWFAASALGISSASGATAAVLVRARLRLAVGSGPAAHALDTLHLVTWSAIPVGALAAGWTARHLAVHQVLVGCGGAWLASAAMAVVASRVRDAAGSARTVAMAPPRGSSAELRAAREIV